MLCFKKLLKTIRIRTLRIDILSLFLSLTILTFICSITFTYFKNYSAILKHSKMAMNRSVALVVERINNIQGDSEQILQNTSGILINNPNTSIHDPELLKFMLQVIQLYPLSSSLFLSFSSGNLISVETIHSTAQTHFLTDPNKPLPVDAVYVVQLLDLNKQPNPEVWSYLDSSFKTLISEELAQPTLDVKARPWYQGAVNTKKLYWSDVYRFSGTNELGLTVSYPIYDKNGNLISVMGTDIPFKGLSDFLNKQKISKSSSTFIINNDGKIIVPELKNLQGVPATVALAAASDFKKSHNHDFSFKFKNIRYLVYVSNLPDMFHQDWEIMTIVPFSDLFGDLVKAEFEDILITLVILSFSIFVIIYFSNRISKPIVTLAKQIDKITNLDLTEKNRVHSYIVEIRMMDNSVSALRKAIHSFSLYVPKEIIQKLLTYNQEISLHVDKKKLTIFFSDIQNFTSISEVQPLNVLMPLLNEYLDGLSKIILKNQGTIDKYIGDSVMAFWGAPENNPNHAVDACRTALECQHFLTEFNRNCREKGNPEFITRFGISTGTVVVGNIGTLERMNYTVIGDTVNTAARLQHIDKIYHVGIIISEATYLQTRGKFLTRPLNVIAVSGKKDKIKIYELVASREKGTPFSETAQQVELCLAFTEAYHQFTEGHYDVAKKLFEEICQKFPEDYPTEFYIDLLAQISRK